MGGGGVRRAVAPCAYAEIAQQWLDKMGITRQTAEIWLPFGVGVSSP